MGSGTAQTDGSGSGTVGSCSITALRCQSTVDDRQGWIETQEIGAVGADHGRLVAPGGYRDGCVDHIAGLRGVAEYPP
jgi:hypothetical protein